MGKKRNVVLIDDIDGTRADETVHFGVDGQLYAIKLSAQNAEALRRTLRRWAACGRRTGTPGRSHLASDPRHKHVRGDEGVVIREWCNDNGYHVGRRGPLPFDAVDAYRSAKAKR